MTDEIMAFDPALHCEYCATPFQRRSNRGRTPRFCSKRCRNAVSAMNSQAVCPCGRKAHATGLCQGCYKRDLRERNPEYAERERERIRAWYTQNRGRVATYTRQYRSLRKYGITLAEYEAALAKPCGICGEASTSLDHCHATGRVRGGLCSRCNTGLGVYETWVQQFEREIQAWLAR